MNINKYRINFANKQQGVALFVALILLLVLTIIGLSAAQRSNLQERMAANTHLKNMAFNAAESAIGGFMAEANDTDSSLDGHVLIQIRIDGFMAEQCYNQAGGRVGCSDTVYLDGDKAGIVKSKVVVTVVDACRGGCPGYSFDSTAKCRVFEIVGTGEIASTTATHTLTAYELTSCAGG